MNKKTKKPMFLSKETLIDLTPHLIDQVQGADDLCGTVTDWKLEKYTQYTYTPSCYPR